MVSHHASLLLCNFLCFSFHCVTELYIRLTHMHTQTKCVFWVLIMTLCFVFLKLFFFLLFLPIFLFCFFIFQIHVFLFFLLLPLYFLFFIFFILFYFLFGPKAPPALFLQGILPESDCMFSQAFWLSEHLTAGHHPPPRSLQTLSPSFSTTLSLCTLNRPSLLPLIIFFL